MENFPNYSNQNYNSPSHEPESSKPALLIILIIIVLALGYFVFKSLGVGTGSDTKAETLPDGNLITKAEGEKIVENFPSEIPLEENALVSESYSIQYVNDNKNLPVVIYQSQLSKEENISIFKTYLENSG